MNLYKEKLKSSFIQRKAVKVISGIDNFNMNKILKIIHACEISQATYIDVVANPKVVSFIKSISSLPICVSSIDPKLLYKSVLVGADLVEIGNFDIFYKNGIYLSSDQVINIARQTRHLLPCTDICVTIPHTMTLYEQINLATKLEHLGINLLQTEGSISHAARNKLYGVKTLKDNILYSASTASAALSSVYAISKATNLPVIASSGINALSASIALSYGASGVGLRSAIDKFENIVDMSCYIDELMFSISQNLSNFEQNESIDISIASLNRQLCKVSSNG